MTPPTSLTHELVDDIPIIMHTLRTRLRLDKFLDDLHPRQGNWQGLSLGQVTVTWLTHILSQDNHFMSHVQDWANSVPHTLTVLLGQPLRTTDLTDDRLAEVVRVLSFDSVWHPLEQAVTQQMVRVYRLTLQRVRLDSTTASVYGGHEASVLFQRGHSKDHRPDLRQLKVMLAALDPLGVLVGADVVPGQRADDGLYVPLIDRLRTTLGESGLLYIGDCKMAALTTRAYLHAARNHYLMPLAQVGHVPEQMAGWVAQALTGRARLTPIRAADGQTVLGEGYEFSRPLTGEAPTGQTVRWQERVLIVRSEAYAEAARRGLRQRLARARAELEALTPPRGRGRKQFTDRAALQTAVDTVLQRRDVTGLLTVRLRREVECRTLRAYAGRPAQTRERQRYVLTVTENQPQIEAAERQLGWRAYVTNAPRRALSLPQAVLAYRDEWLVERDCARLKGCPLSLGPLWVNREDHALGLTRLLTLAARVLALLEFQVRRTLQAEHRALSGLYPGQPTRTTAQPTTERLLKAFDRIILTTLQTGQRVQRHLTPLSELQRTILRALEYPHDLYQRLVVDSPMPLRI